LLKEWREPEPLICGTRKIHPISFGIPESDIVDCVPFKSTDFATVGVTYQIWHKRSPLMFTFLFV